MIRLFLYDSTWFNVDNDTDAQNLLDKGAVEYTSDQIRGVEGNETWVSNDTMFQDEQGWYFHREEPVVPVEEVIADILQKRDDNLSKTDFIFMSDYPVEERFTEENLTEIKAYRQALRDITKNVAYPYVALPTPPECLSNLVLNV